MTALRTLFMLGCLTFCGEAFAQCCDDFKLVRRDTLLGQGIFVIEPKPGFRAKVTFEPIPATIREDFTTNGWTNQSNTNDPFLNSTVSFSNTVGAELVLNFYGSKIELVTAKDKHHGIASYQINNGAPKTVDLYSSARMNDQTVISEPVPFGTNTIRVKVTGLKDPSATGTYVVVDYFKVYP